jgi:hypothetical protein
VASVPVMNRSDVVGAGESAGREVERASEGAARNPGLQKLARVGLYSRAAVYAVIAALALALALGAGGRTTDTRGALTAMSSAPLGGVLMGVVGAGLAALGIWFLIEAIVDPKRTGPTWKRVARRVAHLATGIAYGSLAFFAFRLLSGARGRSHGNAQAQSWTARALELPAGPVLVAIAGAIVAAIGLRRIWVGLRRKFKDNLELWRMGPGLRRWASPVGAAGFVAQGVVFGLIGVFFVQAALEHDAGEATGFDGALAAIARQPAGTILLAAVALGLLAYAAYAIIEGRYRRFRSA